MTFKKVLIPISSLIYSTPTPSSISFMWNFGSLLGVCLLVQLITGFLLSMHYSTSLSGAFDSVMKICEDVNWGWLLRSLHANGASFFFIFIYFHIARGIFYGSFMFLYTWVVGVIILLTLMATAFLGYVLPWGQMSLWGATVITNLLSAVPYIGEMLVQWIWGGFSVSQPTLERFFSIHFILPFLVLILALIHIVFLHSTGSSNPLGVDLNSDKVFFHPFFVVKDLLGMSFMSLIFLSVSIKWGDMFMDPDNSIFANPLSTPPHIQPEWYFLFAYAILRSVPNKLGGVLALMFSIVVLMFLPMSKGGFSQSFLKKIIVWFQVSYFLILTWIGAMPVEIPFIFIGQVVSVLYFFNLLLVSFL